MTTSVTFDQTALSLSPLVVGLYGMSATYFLPPDGITWPALTMRRTYAPDSIYIDGKDLLSAVADSGVCQLSIYVQADSTADLFTAQDALEVAATQWAYDLTLTLDGVSRTFQADPEIPQWGQIDAGMLRAYMSKATITIPVNPPTS